MKTRKPKITFTVELHEMEDLRWLLRLRREENGMPVESTGINIDERKYLETTANRLASVVGAGPIEVRTFEELLPVAIAMCEHWIRVYEAAYLAAATDKDREGYIGVLSRYRADLIALRAWTRASAIAVSPYNSHSIQNRPARGR